MPRGKERPHDDFKDWTITALIWVRENWQIVLEFTTVAAVIFLVIVGASSYWNYRSQSAAKKFYEAHKLAANSDEQIQAFADIAKNYSRTNAGQQAMLSLADIYLTKQEYDKGIDTLKMLAGRSRNQAILMVAALHKMAALELAKGDFTTASETFLKAASNPHNLVANLSRFNAALCLERAGDAQKAAGLYRQILDDLSDTDQTIRNASEERLLWLMTAKRIEG